MKRLISLTILSIGLLFCSPAAQAQLNGLASVKFNTRGEIGFDAGLLFQETWGLKIGTMTDMHAEKSSENGYSESLGKNYRRSYTGGAHIKTIDWLWLGMNMGYGEYGTYGYRAEDDLYGVSGKVKGFEIGVQLEFHLSLCVLEIGYGTIPKGFSIQRPFNDIVFGIGYLF